jgi:dTDP-4-amino-4,6-dideoxygalactose transaminase
VADRRILLSPPAMGPLERAMVLDAFDSGWIAPAGPHLAEFEAETARRCGVAHGVALASGTAALHLGLELVGVGPGDRVLVPTFTFAASANPVLYRGAEPVFVDVLPDTWALDPDLVAEEVERCARAERPPRALVTVDVYGQCADYDRLLPVCRDHGIAVVEDAAEALGSTYRGRPAGSLGTVAAMSFNGNKILTCGGGGLLLTDDPRVADRARHLATQARDPAPHYLHSDIGYNYRLSNLLAAIGRAQLASLDDRVAARRRLHDAYHAAFTAVPGITVPDEAPYGRSNYWLTCLLVDPAEFGAGPDQLRVALDAAGVEARPTWMPLHRQPVHRGRRVLGGRVADTLFARGLCLPSGPDVADSDVERIVGVAADVRRRGTRATGTAVPTGPRATSRRDATRREEESHVGPPSGASS